MNAAAIRVCLCVFTLGLATATVSAQVAIPTTPKKFGKRTLSEAASNGGAINIGPANPTSPAKVRYITHITLSEPRQWQSSDGKSLVGKLIAFEDITSELEKGAPAPTITPPANPTVVKNGMARLLVNSQPYELPLDRLSQADRDFIEKIRLAVPKTPAPAATPQPAAK